MSVRLRAHFGTFSASSKPISKLMDDIDKEAVQALRDPDLRSKHAAIRSASFVLLSGLLESFLRNSAEAFFVDLNRKGVRFGELPEEMRKTHYVAGAEWLQKIAKDDKKADPQFSATRAALSRLASPATTTSPSLIWEAFAATKGNPGPEVIAEFLRKFGVKNPLFTVESAGGPSESWIRANLQSFIELRNECAHTGANKTVPQPSDIRDYVYFLRRLTLAIAKVLEMRLREMAAAAIATRPAAGP